MTFGKQWRVTLATGLGTLGIGLFLSVPAAAATTAGTVISNTSSAAYSDSNATAYTTQSNTVTTTVQNAPALSVSPAQGTPGSTTISAGGTVTETYTLTNAGNSSGYFALSGVQGTDDGVTSGSASFGSYLVSVPGQTAQTFTTVAAVNSYLSTGNSGGPFLTATSNSITVGVTYTANSGATGTITTELTSTITQPAGTGTTAATSTAVVGEYSDTLVADARLDAQVTVVPPSGSTLAKYTLSYANGGGRAVVAVNRSGLPAGSGITGAGIIVTDKLPSYNGTQLTISGTPAFVTQPTGAQFIYSIDGTTWTTTQTGAAYIGVWVPSTGVGAFSANAGSSHGSVPTPQLSFNFSLTSSAASGAGNATAVTDVANSLFGDSSGFIEGPGITLTTIANTESATTTQTAPAIANTTATLNGAASASAAAAATTAAVLNGPNANPGATGADGTTATDYTVVSYTNGGNLTSTVNGSTVSVPANAASISFANSVENTGNTNDTFTLTSTNTALPSGWTVTFKATPGGSAITTLAVGSAATVTYYVVLTPPASATTFTAFSPYDVPVTATSGNDATKSDVTNDEFLVGGFLQLVKSVAVASGQACSGSPSFTANATTAKPGDCVQYTVTYKNVSPAGGTNSVALSASNVVITEDGTASGGSGGTAYTNNWAANTNGLYATPVDSNGGTLAGYSGGTAAGSTKFTDTIASLAANTSGTVSFMVQVK